MSTLGDSAELLFNGTKFTLTLMKDFNRGSIDVYEWSEDRHDHVFSTTIDWQSTYIRSGLSAGTHTMILKHDGPSAGFIDINSIEILP